MTTHPIWGDRHGYWQTCAVCGRIKTGPVFDCDGGEHWPHPTARSSRRRYTKGNVTDYDGPVGLVVATGDGLYRCDSPGGVLAMAQAAADAEGWVRP